jgi:hypothetical protein
VAAYHSHPTATCTAAAPPDPTQEPARHERWNSKRTELFLDHLAATSNVNEALAVSGMSPSSLYRHRRECPAFRAAWNEALDEGYSRLEAELLNRARNGETQEVVNRSGEVVVVRKVSNTLGLALLKLHQIRAAVTRDVRGTSNDELAIQMKMKFLKRIEQLVAHRAEQAARGEPTPDYRC